MTESSDSKAVWCATKVLRFTAKICSNALNDWLDDIERQKKELEEAKRSLAQERERQVNLSGALVRIGDSVQSLNSNDPPVEALMLIAGVVELMSGNAVRVSFSCPDDFDSPTMFPFWCSAGTPRVDTSSPLTLKSVAGYCWEKQKIIYLPDRTDPDKSFLLRRNISGGYDWVQVSLSGCFQSRTRDEHWKSLLCVPIRHAISSCQHVPAFGMLNIDCHKSNAFNDINVAIVESCTNSLSWLFTSRCVESVQKSLPRGKTCNLPDFGARKAIPSKAV